MIRRILLIFVLLSVLGWTQIYIPLPYSNNQLVYGIGLPEEMISIIPDSATQILNNPAKAGGTDIRFGYLTYLSNVPYFQLNPIYDSPYKRSLYFGLPLIHANVLFGKKKSKWLISTGGNQRLYRDDEYDQANDRNDENSWQRYAGHFKISRIFENFSVGFIGQVYFNSVNDNSYSKSSDYAGSYEYYREDEIFGSENIKIYQLGIESSFNGNNWNGLFRYMYSMSEGKHHENRYNYDYRHEYNYQDIRESLYTSVLSYEKESDIHILDGFINYQPGWISTSDLLNLTINWSYTNTDNKYNIEARDFYERIIDDSTVYYYDRLYSSNLDETTPCYNFNVSVGYFPSWKKSILTFQTGLILRYQYLRWSYYYPEFNAKTSLRLYHYSSFRMQYENLTSSASQLIFPIVFYVNPHENFQIYSGMITKVNYELNHNDESIYKFEQGEPYLIKNIKLNKKIYSSLYWKLNFGAKYVLLEDFHIQVAFSNEFFRYSTWNLSLGYHF